MTDVVIRDLKRGKSRAGKKTGSVREKRMRNSEGKLVRVLSLDANSATFIDDLRTVFEKNVAKARLENVKLFGSPEGRRTKNGSRAKKLRPAKGQLSGSSPVRMDRKKQPLQQY